MFIRLITLNRVKLGCAVTFTKYFTSVVSIVILPKSLIWNKTMFPTSNLLNLAELVVNELVKSISKNACQYSFFYLIYHCLMYRLQELIIKELDNFNKNLISIVFY